MTHGRSNPGAGPETAAAVRAAWILVAAAACIPYLRTIPDYFIQDDFGVVQLLARKPWSTFPQWFAMPWMEDIWGYTPDEIRPFPALSYQITALWGAAAPEGHHLLNIALHAINALLVFALARSAAGLSLAGATVAGIVFALLPVAPESVAWITGRVDSMPALFYMASFLAYVQWRQAPPAAARLYLWSLGWFFLALFSKQNTITMVATIAAFDLVVLRRPIRLRWDWLRPYIPFAAMTAGFLALRYVVLGEVLRENQLSLERILRLGGMIGRHVQRIVLGDVGGAPDWVHGVAAAYVLAASIAILRTEPYARARMIRAALYFGPIWIALGLAPALAAGYESPRHAYLAAAGWPIVAAIAFDALWQASRTETGASRSAWRPLVVTATAVLVLAYGVRLTGIVRQWSVRAAISESMTVELERQVLAAPEGALFLVAAPVPSWEWSAPFMAKPPYTATDLTARARIITARPLNCCRGEIWNEATRRALDEWAGRPGAPVIAVNATANGEIRRLIGADDPDLETLVRFLPTIASSDNLDGAVQDILRKLVAGRGTVVVPAR